MEDDIQNYLPTVMFHGTPRMILTMKPKIRKNIQILHFYGTVHQFDN